MPTFNIGPVTSGRRIAYYHYYAQVPANCFWNGNSFQVFGNRYQFIYDSAFAWYNPTELATLAAMLNDIDIDSVRLLMPASTGQDSVPATVAVTPIANNRYTSYSYPFQQISPYNISLPSPQSGETYVDIGTEILDVLLSSENEYNGLVFTARAATVTGTYSTTLFPILSVTYSYRTSTVTTDSPVEFGSTLTATITASRSAYRHKLTLRFGTKSKAMSIAAADDDVTTTYTANISIPASWAAEMTDATQGQGTLTVETLNGSTSYGTSTVDVVFNVPASMAPTPGTISYSVPNNLHVPISNQKLIASLSGQAGKQGATIKDYMLSCEGYASNSAPLTVESIPRVPNEQQWQITITATVTDSRGMTAQTTLNVTVYAWDVPFFSSLSVRRCNSLGEVTEDGHYAKVEGVYGCFSVNNLNSIQSCTLKIVRKSTGDETSAGSLTSGVPKVIGNDTLLSNEEYVVKLTLVDEVASITYEMTVYSMAYVMHFKAGGTGVAFGQAATEDNTVRINPRWALKIGNDLDVAAILTDLMSRVDALDGGGNS